jgi:hypothetical protein
VARYRSSPVAVDAVHWTGTNRGEVEELAGNAVQVQPDGAAMFWAPAGSVWAPAGSWLVLRGGGFEVLDEAAFAARYEPAED